MRKVSKFFKAVSPEDLHRNGDEVHTVRKAGERLPRRVGEKVVDDTCNSHLR